MISIKSSYKPRHIKFIEIFECNVWQLKMYSITMHQALVSKAHLTEVKANIATWLQKSETTSLINYQLGTVIIHEGKEGCFAIINWWIDENMLQQFVYLKQENSAFELYSNNGIITCVWEMAVLWHERNAWVYHILKNNTLPNVNAYLLDQLNTVL